jgi:type II secretory pathway component PulF
MTQLGAPSQYLYTAIAPDGAKKRGVRAAADETALADQLGEDGLLLLSSRRLPGLAAPESELPVRDQVQMNRQIGDLVDRGVPLIEALEVAASVVTDNTARKIEKIRSLVGGGASFAEACERVGGFDPISVTIYRSAERTGALGEACLRVADAAHRRQQIASKATTLMIYPAVVLVIGALVSIFVLTFTVPQIGETFIAQDIDLPWYTDLAMAMSAFIRETGLFLLIAVALLAGVVWVGRRAVGATLLRALRLLPPVQRVATTMESARFFAIMAAMTRSGVPVADALGVATQAVSEPRLRTQLETMRRRLIEGGVFRTLIDEIDALPLATRRLLMAGERGGDLDAVFEALARDLASEVDTRSERLLALLEPAILVALFLVVGGLLLSIMLPLMTLSGQVS